MASRFWVGGTGTWDASDTTHWATASNGAGGASVPGSSDAVTFDASSGGGTVTNLGGGQYDYTPTQAETNGVAVSFLFSATGDVIQNLLIFTVL